MHHADRPDGSVAVAPPSADERSGLTVLLVEPPQLNLVGFMLGLLLQPAGPENRGERSPNGGVCLMFQFSTDASWESH